MITNASPMACGNCGHGLFKVFYRGQDTAAGIMVECQQCKSVTEVRVSKPELVLDWGDGAEGILCRMAPKTP